MTRTELFDTLVMIGCQLDTCKGVDHDYEADPWYICNLCDLKRRVLEGPITEDEPANDEISWRLANIQNNLEKISKNLNKHVFTTLTEDGG